MQKLATPSTHKVLGVNDDRDTCCCCGKSGLKRVVWIQDLEGDGGIQWFGTTCATKRYPALFGKYVGGSAATQGKANLDTVVRYIHYTLLEASPAGQAYKEAFLGLEGVDATFAERLEILQPLVDAKKSQEASFQAEAGIRFNGRTHEVADWERFAAALYSIS